MRRHIYIVGSALYCDYDYARAMFDSSIATVVMVIGIAAMI